MQPFEDALRLAQETVNTGAMRHVRESAAVLRLRLEEIILSAGLAQQKLDHGRRESVAGMLRLMRMLTVAYSFRFDYTSGESYCAMFLRRFGEEARDAMFEGRFDVEVVRTTNFFPVSELDLARGFPRTKEEVSRRPASDAELAAADLFLRGTVVRPPSISVCSSDTSMGKPTPCVGFFGSVNQISDLLMRASFPNVVSPCVVISTTADCGKNCDSMKLTSVLPKRDAPCSQTMKA